MTFEEYYDLVKRIESLENSNITDYMLFIPLCVFALVLVVFTIYAVAIWIDIHKRNNL